MGNQVKTLVYLADWQISRLHPKSSESETVVGVLGRVPHKLLWVRSCALLSFFIPSAKHKTWDRADTQQRFAKFNHSRNICVPSTGQMLFQALVSKNKMGGHSDFQRVCKGKGEKLNCNNGKPYSKVGAEWLQGTEAVRVEEGEEGHVELERTMAAFIQVPG